MKPKGQSRLLASSTALIVATFATSSAFAASATWNGTTNATWATDTNWSATPAPGSADTATFNNAGNANTTIDLGAGVSVGSIVFDTATTAGYTLGSGAVGSQVLTLNGSSAITVNATVAANQLINANLSLGAAAGAQAFTLANLKTTINTLTVAGAVSTTQTGVKTLTVNSAGLTNISGTVSDGSGTVSLNKTGTNLLTLSGPNSYSGGTLITGILNAANSSALGTAGVTVNNATGNQLQLANGVNVANALTISGGGIAAQGVVYVPTGNATFSGTVSAVATSAGGHFATAGYVDNALTIAGNNTITSSVPINIRNGVVIYAGTQNYTGGTTMNGASFLQFKKIASMPATGAMTTIAGGTIAVNAGGAGEFNGGTGAGTIGGLIAGTGGQGAAVNWIAGTSMAVDTTNATATVTQAGALTPAVTVGLMKLGTGTLELTGGGTYAGNGIGGFPFIARQGTLLLNGGTHTVTGEAVVGGLFGKANGVAGLDAKLQVDSGTLAISTYLSLGRGNGIGAVSSDLVTNNAAIVTAANFSAGYNGGTATNLPKGTFTLNNTSSFTISGAGVFNFAESPGSNMSMTLNDSAQVIATGAGAKTVGNAGIGTVILNGGSSMNFGGVTTIGGTATAIGSSLTRNGTGNLTLGGNVVIGNTASTGTLTLNNTSVSSIGGIAYVGNTGGTGTLNLNGSASLTTAGVTNIGFNTGTGTLTMAGGTWNNTSEVRVGAYDTGNTATPNGSGTLTISGGTANLGALTLARGNGSLNTVSGTGTISGTAIVNSASDVTLGFAGSNNLGKLTVSGGTLNVGTIVPAAAKWLMVGRWDTSKGQLDISSGSVNLYNSSAIKMNADGTVGANVVNQSGGAVTFYSDAGITVGGTGNLDLQRAGAAASNNTYNLNGGTLTVPQVASTATTGSRTFNFNGGTIKPTATSTTFFNLGAGTTRANVRNGGAKIDSNGFNITVAQSLVHSDVGGDAATDGGLTKSGNGILTLNSAHTYTGPTVVSAGTLTLANSGSVDTSSSISINGSNAKLIQTSTAPIASPVTVTQGSVDGVGTINTLTVASAIGNTITTGNGGAGVSQLSVGTLTFQGAATLNLQANGTNMERYIYTNDLATPSNGTVINVTNVSGAWTSGTDYPLIYFTNYAAPDATHFTLGSIPGLNPNQTATLVNNGVSIALSITGESLVWTGNVNSNWTTTAIGGSKNWSYLGNGIEFSTNSPVIFDDTASRFSVNLAQNVSPNTVVFNNTDPNDYTISSTGGFGIITGSVIKNGSGKVTMTTNNTYTGSTVINEGILEIGNGATNGSIASSSTITNNSNLIFNLVGSPNLYANPITGTGSITKQGSGTLTLSGANTFTGNFTLDAGVLNFNSAGALGTGPGTIILNAGTLDNTSGAAIASTSTKPQNWNADFTFTGTNDLALGTGQVTLGGAGTSRTVTVSAGTFGTGKIASTGYDLVKAGPGALRISGGVSVINGIVSIQAGTVGTSEDFYADGLAGTGTFENGTANSKWSFWNITTDQTSGGIIQNGGGTGLLGLIKRGAGTWTLTNNANNATSNLSVDSGKLVLANTGSYGCTNAAGAVAVNTSVIGYNANGVLEINGATVNYNNSSNADNLAYRTTLLIGATIGNSAGAVRLNSGSLTSFRQLTVAGVNGSFGGYTQTGGTTNVGGFLAVGLGTSIGVLNQSGGIYNQTTYPITLAASTGSAALVNLSGSAVFNVNGTVDNGLWVGENAGAALNVSGSAALNFAVTNNGLQLARNAAASGVVNLLGGNVTTPKVYRGAGAGTLNFNGGTLTANAASTAFLTGLTETFVRSGGGTINNGGNAITIGQPLLAPTGNGVSATGLTVSGGGYIDTPLVQITGDGTGATAVANIDSTGNLTGITMTNRGNGYITPPTFTLIGGGVGNTGAIGGTATLTATTSGAMTFSGAAITTLAGSNTYTGNTVVGTGTTLALDQTATLQFAPGANGVSNKVTGTGTAFFYGNFSINLAGASIANGNSWTLVDVSTRTFDSLLFNIPGGFTQASDVWTKVEGNNTWRFYETGVNAGKLTLEVATSGGYTTWASTNAPVGTAKDDYDNDGVANGVEYLLGGLATTNDLGKLPGLSLNGGDLVFTFVRKQDSETPDTTAKIEVGTSLASWPASYAVPNNPVAANPGVTVVDNGNGTDTITLRVPQAPDAKKFARLVVNVAP
ncbi:MAG: autotransporter-associated beta strand repeat-containing protein [Luteolibacter sp.]|uniref:autotransporter-associated beta strand repeat-containing protein n=1 Tax=Luteolibacter sp. TaxID=1962973 RepID=UPI0032655534